MRPLRPTDPPMVAAFTLDGILGEGSQGTAYLATGSDGRQVALKLLHAHLVGDEEAQQRFLREVEVATTVEPLCTARVLATGTASGRPYVVSEYVSGPTLETAVTQRGPRQGGALDRLAIGTATALAAIHRAGVIHGDFKPANVIVSKEGPVVVGSGIAGALDKGTETGPPADIFSWACTIVFAGTGQPPFPDGDRDGDRDGEPDLGALGSPMREVVAACLAKDPARRPTASKLVALLTGDAAPAQTPRQSPVEPDARPASTGTASTGSASTGSASTGSAGGVSRPARRGRGRKPLFVTLAIALVCTVAGGAGYALAGPGAGKTSARSGPTPAGTARVSAVAAAVTATATATSVAPSPSVPVSTPAAKPRTPVGPDLVINGTFASGVLAPWFSTGGTVLVVPGGPHGRGRILMMTSGGGGSGAEQIISGLRPGVTYELTGWVASTGGAQTWLGVKLYAGPRTSSGQFSRSSHWIEETMFFTAGPGHSTAHVYCWRKPKGVSYCTAVVVRALR